MTETNHNEAERAALIETLARKLWDASHDFYLNGPRHSDYGTWEELTTNRQNEHRAMARAAIDHLFDWMNDRQDRIMDELPDLAAEREGWPK